MSEQPAPSARHTILDAAAECFAMNGFNATSIDDIARHMGATKGKVYHHFRSKAALLAAVRKHSVQLTLDHVRPVYLAGGPTAPLFHAMARAHVEVMIRALAYHRVVVEALREPEGGATSPKDKSQQAEVRQLQERYENQFRDVLRRGVAEGAFRDAPVSVTLHSVLMLLHAPIYWYTPRPTETEADRAAIATQIADMALGAVMGH